MSTVQAIQWLKGNNADIQEFVGDNARAGYARGGLSVRNDRINLFIRDGEFVVKHEDGTFSVMTAQRFNAMYMNETEAAGRDATNRLHFISSGGETP